MGIEPLPLTQSVQWTVVVTTSLDLSLREMDSDSSSLTVARPQWPGHSGQATLAQWPMPGTVARQHVFLVHWCHGLFHLSVVTAVVSHKTLASQ